MRSNKKNPNSNKTTGIWIFIVLKLTEVYFNVLAFFTFWSVNAIARTSLISFT